MMKAPLALSAPHKPAVVIRQAGLSDVPAIRDMLVRLYPEGWQLKALRRWSWLYRENPVLEAGDVPLWVAEDSGTGLLLGQTGTMRERATVAGDERVLGWSVDTIVSPELRGRGIGVRLQSANQDANTIFAAVNPSPVNERVKIRIGGRHIMSPYVEYLRFVRPDLGTMVRQRRGRGSSPGRSIVGDAAWVGVSGLVANTLKLYLEVLKRGVSRWGSCEVRLLDHYDDRFTELWEQCRHRYVCAVDRTSMHLNWKFGSQPGRQYKACAAFAEGRLVAYATVRMTTNCSSGRTHMAVADQLHADGYSGALREILVRLIAFATSKSMEYVRIATSDTRQARLFRHLGFVAVRRRHPIVSVPSDPALMEVLVQKPWLLTRGDHDCDQPELCEEERGSLSDELDACLRTHRC